MVFIGAKPKLLFSFRQLEVQELIIVTHSVQLELQRVEVQQLGLPVTPNQ